MSDPTNNSVQYTSPYNKQPTDQSSPASSPTPTPSSNPINTSNLGAVQSSIGANSTHRRTNSTTSRAAKAQRAAKACYECGRTKQKCQPCDPMVAAQANGACGRCYSRGELCSFATSPSQQPIVPMPQPPQPQLQGRPLPSAFIAPIAVIRRPAVNPEVIYEYPDPEVSRDFDPYAGKYVREWLRRGR